MFGGLDRGAVHFAAAAPSTGYELVVRQTSSRPDLIGGGTQTHDMSIAVEVI